MEFFTRLELSFRRKGFFKGEIRRGINSTEQIFCKCNFLLGGRIFIEKISTEEGIPGMILKTTF